MKPKPGWTMTDDEFKRLPCLICRRSPVDIAHVNYSDAGHDVKNAMSKRRDMHRVPLCHQCHQDGPEAQHKSGERAWWERHGIDPYAVAALLRGMDFDEARIWIYRGAQQEQTA